MYVAVLLKSESADYYQYLLEYDTPQDVLDQLVYRNSELQDGWIDSFYVESNDNEVNQQIDNLISEYIEEAFDKRYQEDDEE